MASMNPLGGEYVASHMATILGVSEDWSAILVTYSCERRGHWQMSGVWLSGSGKQWWTNFASFFYKATRLEFIMNGSDGYSFYLRGIERWKARRGHLCPIWFRWCSCGRSCLVWREREKHVDLESFYLSLCEPSEINHTIRSSLLPS